MKPTSARQGASNRDRIRRLRKQYRRNIIIVGVIFFIIGLAAGVFGHRWYVSTNPDIQTGNGDAQLPAVTPTPLPEQTAPEEEDEGGFDQVWSWPEAEQPAEGVIEGENAVAAAPETEEAPSEPTEAPTPEPTEEPTPEPTEAPTPEPTEAPSPEPTEAPTPEPTEAHTPEPTEAPTPEPTEEPTPEPTEEPTPEPTEAPTPEPTEEPTPEPTVEPTPEPAVEEAAVEAAPAETPAESQEAAPAETPAESQEAAPAETPAESQEAAPAGTPAESVAEVPAETSAESGEAAPAETPAEPVEEAPAGPKVMAIVPYGESFTYTTQINADGSARLEALDEPFETVSFTQTMKTYMRPSDFATKYSTQYKLQGNEAGAGFELVLNDYTGSAAIVPQNVVDISLCSESGNSVERGYQLMDAEIAGNYGIALVSDTPKMLYKRYQYSNVGEEMYYLVVTTYNDGVPRMILFELESSLPEPEPEIIYNTLQRGIISDEVANMQARLVELGYLKGTADGQFGPMTEEAIKAAQTDFGMEPNGIADNAFQQKLFEGAEPTPAPEAEAAGESADAESTVG